MNCSQIGEDRQVTGGISFFLQRPIWSTNRNIYKDLFLWNHAILPINNDDKWQLIMMRLLSVRRSNNAQKLVQYVWIKCLILCHVSTWHYRTDSIVYWPSKVFCSSKTWLMSLLFSSSSSGLTSGSRSEKMCNLY